LGKCIGTHGHQSFVIKSSRCWTVCCIVYTLPLEPKGSEGKGMVPALLLTSPVHRALVPGNARPELKSYRHIKSHVAFLHVNIRVAPKLLRPRDVKGIQVSHMRSQNVWNKVAACNPSSKIFKPSNLPPTSYSSTSLNGSGTQNVLF
jgi:hypothetical protein